jgi:hypothetical protein
LGERQAVTKEDGKWDEGFPYGVDGAQSKPGWKRKVDTNHEPNTGFLPTLQQTKRDVPVPRLPHGTRWDRRDLESDATGRDNKMSLVDEIVSLLEFKEKPLTRHEIAIGLELYWLRGIINSESHLRSVRSALDQAIWQHRRVVMSPRGFMIAKTPADLEYSAQYHERLGRRHLKKAREIRAQFDPCHDKQVSIEDELTGAERNCDE